MYSKKNQLRKKRKAVELIKALLVWRAIHGRKMFVLGVLARKEKFGV